jgi:hypothetical protein
MDAIQIYARDLDPGIGQSVSAYVLTNLSSPLLQRLIAYFHLTHKLGFTLLSHWA